MSVISSFVSKFDSLDRSHVEWLSQMMDLAENMGPDKKFDMVQEINKNPLGLVISSKDALEWPHIHFCLCAVYAKSVLRNKAYVPSS